VNAETIFCLEHKTTVAQKACPKCVHEQTILKLAEALERSTFRLANRIAPSKVDPENVKRNAASLRFLLEGGGK